MAPLVEPNPQGAQASHPPREVDASAPSLEEIAVNGESTEDELTPSVESSIMALLNSDDNQAPRPVFEIEIAPSPETPESDQDPEPSPEPSPSPEPEPSPEKLASEQNPEPSLEPNTTQNLTLNDTVTNLLNSTRANPTQPT